jgi:hypothetical protein
MQYMMLIYSNEADWASLSEEQRKAELQQYFAFTKETRERGMLVAGEEIHPTQMATTVRVRDGNTTTAPGPFAQTQEQLGGYYVLNCKDLDEAIEMAAKIPGAKNGSVEIRPLVVFN